MGTGFIVGIVVLGTLIISPSPNLLVRLIIFFWNLSILANILKYAMGIHQFQAGLLSVVYAFLLNKLVIVVEDYLAHSNLN